MERKWHVVFHVWLFVLFLTVISGPLNFVGQLHLGGTYHSAVSEDEVLSTKYEYTPPFL
ncbi:hypothetical protein NE584_00550 [Clostridium sp. DFI.5.61]|uniref:hypothetical protein n=1 Tax=Clostridium sp. DFI.5.61 TaxID=2965279 RepID=UPI00210A3BC8|nr:hypothetical protein [Clostridium sp. DFI.5.61]MCB5924204.1 hypothetical protein [bacterium 210820-DFI.5.26]MCQ5157529.1 hypothetical protein [Clostridium sp. DFI.5.61]